MVLPVSVAKSFTTDIRNETKTLGGARAGRLSQKFRRCVREKNFLKHVAHYWSESAGSWRRAAGFPSVGLGSVSALPALLVAFGCFRTAISPVSVIYDVAMFRHVAPESIVQLRFR